MTVDVPEMFSGQNSGVPCLYVNIKWVLATTNIKPKVMGKSAFRLRSCRIVY